MLEEKAICLLIGKFPTYLDHLAPLSIELGLPLIFTEPNLYERAIKYYPNINAQQVEFFHLVSHYLPLIDSVICCTPPKVLRVVFSKVKDLNYYWTPHGSSEKGGMIQTYFEHLREEKNILVYEKGLKDLINRDLNLKPSVFNYTKNYRYYHFSKNKSFYMKKVDELGITSNKPLLLYAPSWNGREESSSISSCKLILHELQEKYQVICKWHPDLLWQEKELIKEIELSFPSIYFLKEFPLIYPLLSIIDVYVGDVSSVGYDFLAFEKPMVFLNEKNRSLDLFSCGRVLCKEEYKNILSAIEKAKKDHNQNYLPSQKKLYEYNFGKKEDVKEYQIYMNDFKNKILSKINSSINA